MTSQLQELEVLSLKCKPPLERSQLYNLRINDFLKQKYIWIKASGINWNVLRQKWRWQLRKTLKYLTVAPVTADIDVNYLWEEVEYNFFMKCESGKKAIF